jgi:hypothetical protein
MSETDTLSHINKIVKYANDFVMNNMPTSHPMRYYYDKKKVFYKKKQAYNYSDAHGKLPIFSVDISNQHASKAYIVTGYVKWWENYSSIEPAKRYAYEVVLPGVPCHLYVDLEAEFSANPEIKDTIQIRFVELLAELKDFLYNMHVAPKELLDKTRFVVLDSSKSTKFSKHCIVKIPEVLFDNNYHCGALIRRFQIHILNKFGPKETNPYFVFPENEEKRDPQFKQFLIDMGVYTKGRDFRLLGSYKRAGNNDPKKKKRFLWLYNKPGILNDVDFFDTLIQFQPKPSTIRYYVSHIIDTVNGGDPMSSSLRTVAPVGEHFTEWGNVLETTGNSVVGFVESGNNRSRNKRMKPSNINPCPAGLVQGIANMIKNKYKIEITGFQRRGNVLFYNTNYHGCRIKSKVTKSKGATHSKNVIFFQVFGNSGVVKQSCFNQTYCFDTSTNKHRTDHLFTIRDPDTVRSLMDWCESNGWPWRGDPDFLIPDEWMGSDSDTE